MSFRSWVAPLLLLAALSGCGPAPTSENIVTLALDVPPTNLDPRIGTDASSERLVQLIFNSLVRKDEAASIVPDLAESWEIPDPTTYVFRLREGVRFHDGRPLTARDVVYTFQTVMDGSIRTAKAGTYRLLDEVEALDDHTVVFRLSEPFAPFLWNLARGAIGIVPEGSGPDFFDHPIGSGPFRFEHYIRDGEVLLQANQDYFGPTPKLDAVRFKIIPEAVVRGLELRKGTVDIALNVLPADMIEALVSEPALDVMTAEGTNYQYLAFNLDDPLFGDLRVRQAVAHAIDREGIIQNVWRNQVRVADSVLPPTNWAYFDGVTRYEYDPEHARAILAEAGYTDLAFTYRTSTDETGRLVAEVLQQQLRSIGIDMEIRSNEFATFYDDVIKGNFQMYSLRWIGGNNDPDIFNLIFHSEMVPPNGANRGHYANEDVDRWVDAAQSETDTEKRKEYYELVQKTVSEELPYVSLWYIDNVCVYNRRVQGMKLYPAGEYEFLNEIWIDPS